MAEPVEAAIMVGKYSTFLTTLRSSRTVEPGTAPKITVPRYTKHKRESLIFSAIYCGSCSTKPNAPPGSLGISSGISTASTLFNFRYTSRGEQECKHDGHSPLA
jgi:hypothetical protein